MSGQQTNSEFGGAAHPALSTQDPGWDVQGYAVLPNVFEAGIYSSDHRAVVGDTCLNV